MTFLENKKIFLSLVDEYAPNKTYFTEDEDIQTKCALLYAPAYQELADYRTRKKLKEIEVLKGEVTGYEKVKLPQCKSIKTIIGMDENNNKTNIDFYILGEYIFISNEKDAKIVIEYVPFLNLINENTEDDFELEIDQDLQLILPYKVASDLFKTDPGENYTAFEKEYERRLANINTSNFGININISEGEF
jgi:hypothetical protein